MLYKLLKLVAVSFLFTVVPVQAQVCSRPSEVDVSDRYPALVKRAAYASFIADRCEIANDIPVKIRALNKIIYTSEDDQMRQVDNFNARKREFDSGASTLAVAKRCYVESAKTKAFVNEVTLAISDFEDYALKTRRKYDAAVEEYNECYAREQRRIEQEQAAYREQQRLAAVEQSESNARKKAVQDLEAGWRRSLMQEGTYVLVIRNVGGRTADFVLRCYQNNGSYKSFRMAVTPGSSTELGYLEGWPGNFVPGESCKAFYEDVELWSIKR